MSTNGSQYKYKNNFLYFIESGKWRRGKLSNCSICKNNFAKRIKSNKKYCSKNCANKAKINKIKIICDCCGDSVFKTKSQLNSSKSGLHFCSRVCKEKTQRLDSEHPKANLIRPDHFGTGLMTYSNICKRIKLWVCEDCKCSISYMLCVHHIDGNRMNNPLDGSNWEVLCRNCHCKRHLKLNENNEWVYTTDSLTPREFIKTL